MAHHNITAKSTVPPELKDEYETPKEYFDPLNECFQFDIDAAATRRNALTKNYWTKQDDGLTQSWASLSVFANPPYTGGQYGAWVKKAMDSRPRQWREDAQRANNIVLIIPFNPETANFKPVWKTADYLLLPYKRIRFGLSMLEEPPTSPNFYSCIAIWTMKGIGYKFQKLGRLIVLDTVVQKGRL